MKRHYYRCTTCLVTVTLEENRFNVRCGICGGRLEYLGPVVQDRWLKVEQRPKCDGRCISAKGPRCDCACGGENHGAGLAGFIEVAKDGGPARVTPLDGKEVEAARARAEEFRQLVAEVEELAKRTGWSAWGHIHKAKMLRTHQARVRHLKKAIEFYRSRLGNAAR